MRELHKKGQ